MERPFESKTYYALALDPIHVGVGGYQLGRVDMSIMRETGTNLPIVPGTSIAGVSRAYTALRYNRYHWPKPEEDGGKDGEYYSCAGKGGDKGEKHCGENGCRVCVTYGFSKGVENGNFQGLVQFFDAHILFFPVYSYLGPVWVTSPSAIKACYMRGTWAPTQPTSPRR